MKKTGQYIKFIGKKQEFSAFNIYFDSLRLQVPHYTFHAQYVLPAADMIPQNVHSKGWNHCIHSCKKQAYIKRCQKKHELAQIFLVGFINTGVLPTSVIKLRSFLMSNNQMLHRRATPNIHLVATYLHVSFASRRIEEYGATLQEFSMPGTPSGTKSSGDARLVSACNQTVC